ncbi:MAG: methyltransferase domain-containing protein [Candidatus Aenigmarchaeota archaeon]|nr:methyltransferase domain-containing protein [Candidatus Aenigmarchaeota archaeon]
MSHWSELWSGIESVETKGNTYMWKMYASLLDGCDFKGKRVLEIGCGTGLNTIAMGLKGAEITFLDQSKEALNLVRNNVRKLGLEAEYIEGDVFECGLAGRYDIVHSEGLIEHFIGGMRQKIVDAHAEAARRGGMVTLIAPNMMSVPYRIGMYAAKKTGTWIYGDEYPYSREELSRRMEASGLAVRKTIGGEFVYSLFWLFCPIWLGSKSIIRKGITLEANECLVRLNQGNFFADRWGRIIGSTGIRI